MKYLLDVNACIAHLRGVGGVAMPRIVAIASVRNTACAMLEHRDRRRVASRDHP